ncbi:hypothetical protein [Halosimplex salinum]|uniref:hypothetical protein n=1 Tax=Halosimplex salinum TaxID=1710538 RepID=UPI000F4AE8FC|nr:hypothetical protein [Halosimplex salinum]
MFGSLVARLRQPQYTGENRCLPCTILNVAIASVGATLLVAWLTAAGYATVGLWAGTGVLVLSLAAIWLRGYLVPGTPTLTKRYLPASVLAAFGKTPDSSPEGLDPGAGEGDAGASATAGDAAGDEPAAESGEPLDVEAFLQRAGTIEPCRGDDRCLTEAFGEAWREESEAVGAAEDLSPWFEALAIEGGEVTTTDLGGSFVVSVDGSRVGSWESEPAFEADLAAASLLADRVSGWGSLSSRDRGQVCNGLRIFLETCPSCGGVVSFDTETVESCCTSRTVAAVTCDDCGARVFESPVDDEVAA